MEQVSCLYVQRVLLCLQCYAASCLLEVCAKDYSISNLREYSVVVRLAHARYAQLYALVVINIRIGLRNLYGLGKRLTSFQKNCGTAREILSVHGYSRTVRI